MLLTPIRGPKRISAAYLSQSSTLLRKRELISNPPRPLPLVPRKRQCTGGTFMPADTPVLLKTPKGTRDWFGKDVLLRDHIFKTLSEIFQRHGGTPLDTPVFERKEILAGKYGEDAKLIYDLQDQGGEVLALRFDLTVPFARWLAQTNVTQVKRYHIAKVYRRDNPAIARGRLREFHQCDFDIAGEYDPMISDSQIVRIIVEAFQVLELDITIKINHRRILDGLFTVAGVPKDKIRTISAAVDKLDKTPWVEVKKEMVEEKGLPEDVADRIGNYVKHSGGLREILDLLKEDAELMADADVQAGVADMTLLLTYLDALRAVDKVSFDLSLARGLDYYTGVIFEAINKPSHDPETAPKESKSRTKNTDEPVHVGSIAAGGRYDNLVGMYGKKPIPCVGISFGVDRIFTLLKARQEKEERAPETGIDVYVMAFGGKGFNGLLVERLSIAGLLWDAGIQTELTAKVKPKLPQQFKAATGVPLAVILGEDELAAGQVRVKALGLAEDHPEKDGVLVAKEELVGEVRRRLEELRK